MYILIHSHSISPLEYKVLLWNDVMHNNIDTSSIHRQTIANHKNVQSTLRVRCECMCVYVVGLYCMDVVIFSFIFCFCFCYSQFDMFSKFPCKIIFILYQEEEERRPKVRGDIKTHYKIVPKWKYHAATVTHVYEDVYVVKTEKKAFKMRGKPVKKGKKKKKSNCIHKYNIQNGIRKQKRKYLMLSIIIKCGNIKKWIF